MSHAVGIDLGTTYSALAFVNEFGKPEIVVNSEGSLLTPSIVAVSETPPLVGAAAKELLVMGDSGVAAFFKRSMANRSWVIQGAGRSYTPAELSALVLCKLKADAEFVLQETINDAVITVPAYFNNEQREATKSAGRQAGLNVMMTINEPTAAAIAYGLGKKDFVGKMLVYDLGGGTFDVTLIDITEDDLRVLATDGDHELGGKDWDDRLANYFAASFHEDYGLQPLEEPESYNDIIAASEVAKQNLSSLESTRLRVSHAGERAGYDITREQFEDITRDLLGRTMTLCEAVLGEQKLAWEDLAGVLLVGGSTRMPMVQSELVRRCGASPLKGVNVDEAVAIGAAIQANELSHTRTQHSIAPRSSGVRRLQDVTSHSLGMVALNEDRSKYINSIILAKNQKIPSEDARPHVLQTLARMDNTLEVYLTQGEDSDLRKCMFIGKYVAENVPHRDGETVIGIKYAYDTSGIVHVSAFDQADGTALDLAKHPVPDDMSWVFEAPQVSHAAGHVTCYLVVDLSGSMSGGPLEEAKQAAQEFCRHLDLSRSSIGLVTVADKVRTNMRATQNAKKLNRAIMEMSIGDVGFGNLKSPFAHTADLLQNTRGARFIVLLTDGVWVNQKTAIREAKECHQDNIQVIAIGFGGADRKFLAEVATSEADSFFTAAGQLVDTFGSIAQQITLGESKLRRL